MESTMIFVLSTIITVFYASRYVMADDRPFIYANQSSDSGYGVKSWNRVEPSQYYFNWTRYINNDKTSSNYCSWEGQGQSPINIVEPENDMCNGTNPFDRHRFQTEHGTCFWTDLSWEIKPWGLFMQFPMPESGNYEDVPCRKPSINSSGGLVDRLYATYLMIKAKSEHFLFGKQYDAEISIGHTRYYEEDNPFMDPNNRTIFMPSILVNANETNGDNPILEPYLREWWRVHQETLGACALSPISFPTTTAGVKGYNTSASNNTRRLQDDGLTAAFMNGTWAVFPEFDLYHLLTTPWYFAYRGSLTMPNCIRKVHWRILEQPLEISVRQLKMINEMISNARDPVTCSLITAGVPRDDGTDYVDVNRPLQPSFESNDLVHCNKTDFVSSNFFNVPRGNTGWSLLEAKNLTIPDSYWWQSFDGYNVTSKNGPGDIASLIEGERNASLYFEQLSYNMSLLNFAKPKAGKGGKGGDSDVAAGKDDTGADDDGNVGKDDKGSDDDGNAGKDDKGSDDDGNAGKGDKGGGEKGATKGRRRRLKRILPKA